MRTEVASNRGHVNFSYLKCIVSYKLFLQIKAKRFLALNIRLQRLAFGYFFRINAFSIFLTHVLTLYMTRRVKAYFKKSSLFYHKTNNPFEVNICVNISF